MRIASLHLVHNDDKDQSDQLSDFDRGPSTAQRPLVCSKESVGCSGILGSKCAHTTYLTDANEMSLKKTINYLKFEEKRCFLV